jgi:hypothetical protein
MAAPSISPNAARVGVLDRPVAKPQRPPAVVSIPLRNARSTPALSASSSDSQNYFPAGRDVFDGEQLAGRYEDQAENLLGSQLVPQANSIIKNRIMKREYRNKRRWSPYQRFSFEALTILLAHAKAGSEDEQLLHQERSLRKREPKQDPRQSLLFAVSEWERTRSPWCLQ